MVESVSIGENLKGGAFPVPLPSLWDQLSSQDTEPQSGPCTPSSYSWDRLGLAMPGYPHLEQLFKQMLDVRQSVENTCTI